MKIDLHVHTSETSPCGHVPAAEMVRMYKAAGYDVIVTTDHFYDGFINRCKDAQSDIKDTFLKGYRTAREEGDKIGLRVLLGCEMRFQNNSNDYLLFGITEDFFTEDKAKFTPRTFSDYARDNNILIYQAHPFRVGMTVTKPEYLSGIEVNNATPHHNSHNSIARHWAIENAMHAISGSDAHYPDDVGRGGIISDKDVESMDDLLDVLKSDEYRLISQL